MNRGLLLFAFLLMSGICNAQNAKITGSVNSSLDAPLPYINVVLEGTSYASITDENGEFTIEKVPIGSYSIIASSLGYGKQTKSIKVKPNQENKILFVLTEASIELQSVEIIGRRAVTYNNEVSFGATKTATPIKDIPQAISYVTKEVMADRQAYRAMSLS